MALLYGISVRGEALKFRQAARRLAQRCIALGGKIADARALEKVVDRGAGEGVSEAAGWQNGVGAQAVVAGTDRSIWAEQDFAGVLQCWQDRERLAYLHFKILGAYSLTKSMASRMLAASTMPPV